MVNGGNMLTLAATHAHSLADIGSLPWWAQFAIGLGLVCVAGAAGWLYGKYESCLAAAVAFITGMAGLTVLWNALFGS
jgi:hypothetical protein